MKKIITALLFISLILAGAGCNQKDEVSSSTARAISIYDIFPQERGWTSYYEGALDYGSFETIVNTEEKYGQEEATLILIEGEVEDLSGGEAGDTSFFKKIKVTETAIQQEFGLEEYITLIQAPVQKGTSWTGIWYERAYGTMDVTGTITDVTDKTITVEIVPQNLELYKGFKVLTEYEVGKGMISQKFTYGLNEDGSENYEYQIWLSRTSKIPDNSFISRYVNPDISLEFFYKKKDTYYKRIIGDYQKWMLENRGKLTDEEMIRSYKSMLDSMDRKDLKSISTAKEVGFIIGQQMKDASEVIRAFQNFYEEMVFGIDQEWYMENMPYQTIEKIYVYDNQIKHRVRSIYEIQDPIVRAKAAVLKENGIGISFHEGWAYPSPEEGYLYNTFVNIASESMQDYLGLKNWYYAHEPIMVEGYLTVSPDEVAEHLISLEKFYGKYPDALEVAWVKEQAQYYIKLYIVPNMYNFEMYSNGILSSAYIKSYEKFIQEKKDSSFHPMVKKVYDLLNANSFFYSMDLENYLRDKGYEPTISEDARNLINERKLQSEDFKKILAGYVDVSLYKNEKTVTVKNGQELIEAIASDTTIFLEPGMYIIPYEYTSENLTVQYGELTIKDIKNLVIIGKGDTPVTVVSEAYGYVFSFKNCDNITLSNLRIGHLQLYCKAGVIYLDDTDNFNLNKSILFGCGEWGLEAKSNKGMFISNTLISDCASKAVILTGTEDAAFENCYFTRNGKNAVAIENSKNVLFKKVEISNNKKEYYNSVNALFYILSSENISLEGCVIKENGTDNLSEGKTELKND